MALSRRDVDQLSARMGRDNVLTSQADRIVYSTDIGSPPAIVDMLVKRTADAVVRCHTLEDVQTAIRFCRKRRIPITPRAAATSALGGAVPKRAGVVLDLTPMRKACTIDEATATVTVDAGMKVWDLQEKLLAVGLELPVYPTSGLAATIGGFVAMDGHGIHATRAGNIGKHVVAVEGVGADGEVFRLRDAEQLDFVLGLGGSTGVITQVTIQCMEATTDKPVLVAGTSTRSVQKLIEEATAKFSLKHVMLRNADFFELRKDALGERKNPLGGKNGVFLVFPEPAYAGAKDALEAMAKRLGMDILDDKTADAEWKERFYPIKAKRMGPSLVAGEVFVPVEKLHTYLKRLREKSYMKHLSAEGHVTDDGRVYFFIFTLDDERRPAYPAGWGTSALILSLAKKLGGKAYHSGVWLQWESKSVFGAKRYKKLKDLKRQTDHRNLMNPGMVFPLPAPVPEFIHKAAVAGPVPAPSLGLQLAAGNPMLIMMGQYGRHRIHKTTPMKAVDVAGDMARGGDMGMASDLIWGADLASLQAIPNPGDLPMTQTVRGKLVLAKAFAAGKIADPWAVKDALDIADPDPAEATVAPEYKEVQEVLDAFRRTVTARGVELEVKAVEIVEEVVETADAGGESKDTEMSKEEILAMAKETPEAEKAWVLAADCIVCNGCEAACPTAAAIVTDIARVDRDLCIADGGCFDACPTGAIRPGAEDEGQSAGWPEGSRLAGKFGV